MKIIKKAFTINYWYRHQNVLILKCCRQPIFNLIECLIGKDIGAGGFSIVYDIDAMDLFDNPKNRDHSQAQKLIADLTRTSPRNPLTLRNNFFHK